MQKTNPKTRKRARKPAGNRFVSMYLKEISRIPLLTVEEERELGRRARSGDPTALNKLIESNLRFVIKIARKFVRRPDQLMDLVNVGNVGLIEAAKRFDPEMNVRFTTYAIWWIRQAIFQHLAGMTHVFRIAPKTANTLYRIGRVLRDAPLGSEEIPDREALAAKVGVSLKELNAAFEAVAGTVSLDQPIDEEGNIPMGETLEQKSALSPEEQAMVQSLHRSLEKAIRHLSPFEQKVIRLRFGFNDESAMSLQQIGTKLNRSRERIRQIEKNALKKLKAIYATQTLNHYLN